MHGLVLAIGTRGRWLLGATVLCCAAASAQTARDSFQMSGFATQSFVYSSGNNYLGMDTTSGSPAWTEAAVNLNDEVHNRVRVGV